MTIISVSEEDGCVWEWVHGVKRGVSLKHNISRLTTTSSSGEDGFVWEWVQSEGGSKTTGYLNKSRSNTASGSGSKVDGCVREWV